MTEVRTTSASGGEKGVKPQRHSLIPRHGLDVIAEVFGFGANKYADHNWRKGYEWSKSYDALQRHLTAWWDGEDVDPESGLSHLGHAGFHILVLATWERLDGRGSAYDDRHTFTRETPAEEEERLREQQRIMDHPGFVQCPNACCEPCPTEVTYSYWTPKVGDRVRLTSPRGDVSVSAEVGTLGTVVQIGEGMTEGDPLLTVRLDSGETTRRFASRFEECEEVGYTTEESIAEDAGFKFGPLPQPDLRAMQDYVNRMIRNLVAVTQPVPEAFKRNEVAVRRNEDYSLPLLGPSPFVDAAIDPNIEIEWKDPQPRTFGFTMENVGLPTLRVAAGWPRFTVDSLGVTSDFDNPAAGPMSTLDELEHREALNRAINRRD